MRPITLRAPAPRRHAAPRGHARPRCSRHDAAARRAFSPLLSSSLALLLTAALHFAMHPAHAAETVGQFESEAAQVAAPRLQEPSATSDAPHAPIAAPRVLETQAPPAGPLAIAEAEEGARLLAFAAHEGRGPEPLYALRLLRLDPAGGQEELVLPERFRGPLPPLVALTRSGAGHVLAALDPARPDLLTLWRLPAGGAARDDAPRATRVPLGTARPAPGTSWRALSLLALGDELLVALAPASAPHVDATSEADGSLGEGAFVLRLDARTLRERVPAAAIATSATLAPRALELVAAPSGGVRLELLRSAHAGDAPAAELVAKDALHPASPEAASKPSVAELLPLEAGAHALASAPGRTRVVALEREGEDAPASALRLLVDAATADAAYLIHETSAHIASLDALLEGSGGLVIAWSEQELLSSPRALSDPAAEPAPATRLLLASLTLDALSSYGEGGSEGAGREEGLSEGQLEPGGPGAPITSEACLGDRYVSPTGSDDANDCTDELAPCLTISHAISESCEGETVFVAEGDYNEDIVVDKGITIDSSGTSVNTTVIGSNTTDVVSITAANATWEGVEITGAPDHACLRVGSETAVDLRGLSIRNSAFYGCAIGLLMESTGSPVPGGPFNRVLSVDARDNVTDGTPGRGIGIVLRGGNGRLEIKSSFLRNNAGAGMVIEAPTGGRTNENVIIIGNRFLDNGLDPNADTRQGIVAESVSDLRLEGNRFAGQVGLADVDDANAVELSSITGNNFFCNRIENNDTAVVMNAVTDLEMRSSRFTSHLYRGVVISADSGANTLLRESIFENNPFAIDYEGDATFDARRSWWNAADGPSGDFGGSGDAVFGNVDVGDFIDRAVPPLLVRRPTDFGWNPSIASCFDTLQKGFDAAVEGDLLLVGEGEYRERLTLDKRLDIWGLPTDPGVCSLSQLNGRQSSGSHEPALRVNGVTGLVLRDMTIRGAGEGTTCGENTGEEYGLDLVDVKSSTFERLCFRENGVTELRLYGDVDDNLFRDIDIDGRILLPDGTTEACPHRSREGILIDGGPACEGGAGAIAERNRFENATIRYVTRGVSLRLADDTELLAPSIRAETAPAWDGGAFAVGALLELSDRTLIEGGSIEGGTETEGIRIKGRSAGSCITERENSTGTILRDNFIADVSGPGVRLLRAAGDGLVNDVELTCNDFFRNQTGLRTESVGTGALATFVENNDFRVNDTGVNNLSNETLDASPNWWASQSGPGGSGPGTGDPVFGLVTFSPFQSSSSFNDNDGDTVTECEGDCDDTDGLNFPGNTESCDGQDNDCDGLIDEELPLFTYYRDADGDSFGDPADTTETCNDLPPAGYVANADDCDDTNAAINPGAAEITCDGIDQSCNGAIDEAPDDDGDGYDVCAIADPGDADGLAADCDDADPAINPGVAEVSCDGRDNDCDGTVDTAGLVCEDLAVSGLVFTADAAKDTLSWNAAPAAEVYALYRGTIPAAGFTRYDHLCEGSELSGTSTRDPDAPPLGTAYYYLATGVAIDDVSEDFDGGSLGNDSAGGQRPDAATLGCGPRVYVDPDVVGSSGTGLSWADAYTTVNAALSHGRARSRALEVWARGSLNDTNQRLTRAARLMGVRILGGFAGGETAAADRDPSTTPTTWSGGGASYLLRAEATSALLDGVTLQDAESALVAWLEGGVAGLVDVSTSGLTGQSLDLEAQGGGGGRVIVERLADDGTAARVVRAIARAGTLSGEVRESTLAGGSDAALVIEARPEGATDATTELDLTRVVIEGGGRGIVLGAHAGDGGGSALERSRLRSSVVHSTAGAALAIEASGSFETLATSASARAEPLVLGNTLSEGAGAGVVVSATRGGAAADPALHEVRAEPALWDNLVTFFVGNGVEESADDPAAALVADPRLVGNDLFGSGGLYLDEGTTTLGTIEEVNGLGSNQLNWSEDPLYTDRLLFDFSLQATSPAIERGSEAAPEVPEEDAAGTPRVKGAARDTGAYEALP